MKVFIIVLFLTPIIWLQADALQSESDANMFVIGLAAHRALEIHGFKYDETIADSSISIQTNSVDFTQEQKSKYTDANAAAAVRGKVAVTIRKPASGSTPFSLEFSAEQQTAADAWAEIKSRGVLERELVDEIKNLIERYRKSPSLN